MGKVLFVGMTHPKAQDKAQVDEHGTAELRRRTVDELNRLTTGPHPHLGKLVRGLGGASSCRGAAYNRSRIQLGVRLIAQELRIT